MLLVIDIGNTNTVLGVYDQDKLIANWRLTTQRERTVDEYGILCRNLLSLAGIELNRIRGIAIASVVPPLNSVLHKMFAQYFKLEPLFIEPDTEVGMPILYNPRQDVGADRIVNGVAAFEKFGGPVIVADFGTATTFDVVSKKGEYVGGVIAPGITISAEALFLRTAKLPRVEIKRPERVIGDSTVHSIQSGLYFGYVALVDGVLRQIKKELGKPYVVATGGLAWLISAGCQEINSVEENLTLEGLRIIYSRIKRIRN